MMPIYRTGKTPEAEAEKINQAYGWSYVVLRMQDVLGDSGVNLAQIRLELQDLTTPGAWCVVLLDRKPRKINTSHR